MEKGKVYLVFLFSVFFLVCVSLVFQYPHTLNLMDSHINKPKNSIFPLVPNIAQLVEHPTVEVAKIDIGWSSVQIRLFGMDNALIAQLVRACA